MAFDELAERKARTALESGDFDTALALLMKTYGQDIYRYCLSMLATEADAKDTMQTVFLQAYQALDSFAGNSTFRTWLFSISRHRCLDRLKMDRRLHARVQFVEDPPDPAGPEDDIAEGADSVLKRILHECLGQLSGNVRTAVLLRFQAEMPYTELASVMQAKAGTLQAQVARALPLLRRCVEEHGVVL